jgi:hypothetical protein
MTAQANEEALWLLSSDILRRFCRIKALGK